MASNTAEKIKNDLKAKSPTIKTSNLALGIGKLINDLNGTTINNQFTAEQAQIQREYEERLSNTAYQRAKEDMKAAGLNPAMMFGTGTAAAVPTGSSASAINGNGLQSIASIVSSASQVLNARTNAYNSKINAGKLIYSAAKLISKL